MSSSLLAWLLEAGPFEAAMRKYLAEDLYPPQPFYPPDRLESDEYALPECRAQENDDEWHFLTSVRVHFEFSGIIDCLTYQAFSDWKRKYRSDHFQAFKAFAGPFLICRPHRPWNEFGGDIGAAISWQALRAVLRFRDGVDPDALRAEFESLNGRDPWKQMRFRYFTDFDRFAAYYDQITSYAQQAVDAKRVLLMAIY